MNQNIITTYWKTRCSIFGAPNSCHPPWHEYHNSLVDSRTQIVQDVQQGSHKSGKFNLFFGARNYRSKTPQICSVELRSDELDGQDLNWNPVLCSQNQQSYNLNSRPITSNNIFLGNSIPFENTDNMQECKWSTVIFRQSTDIMVCCTITTGRRDIHENIPQNILSQPAASV